LRQAELVVTVWDWNGLSKNRVIGEVRLSLADVRSSLVASHSKDMIQEYPIMKPLGAAPREVLPMINRETATSALPFE
jgi:hypothetical protein